MEFNDKIERIVQNQKIKKRLQEIGIYSTQGPTGPTGPSGRGLEILGSYDSLEELKKNHEKGEIGQSYLVNGILYVWNGEKNSWVSAGNVQGPTGPKGDQGLIGPIGPKGGNKEFRDQSDQKENKEFQGQLDQKVDPILLHIRLYYSPVS